jgi:hypothetical protein
MTLGRTSSNAIKIKTDSEGGGLRAVECACCESTFDYPCKDCPPFLADFNFSLTGDQVSGLTEFQYPAAVCPGDECNLQGFPTNLEPRTCADYWDAFGPGPVYDNLYMISIYRAGHGFYGAPLSQGCCWVLSLYVQGILLYDYMGEQDLCGVNAGDSKIITSLDPRGSYPMTISAQCIPPFMGGPTEFNFTVTVS